jgi:hypothetical protein
MAAAPTEAPRLPMTPTAAPPLHTTPTAAPLPTTPTVAPLPMTPTAAPLPTTYHSNDTPTPPPLAMMAQEPYATDVNIITTLPPGEGGMPYEGMAATAPSTTPSLATLAQEPLVPAERHQQAAQVSPTALKQQASSSSTAAAIAADEECMKSTFVSLQDEDTDHTKLDASCTDKEASMDEEEDITNTSRPPPPLILSLLCQQKHELQSIMASTISITHPPLTLWKAASKDTAATPKKAVRKKRKKCNSPRERLCHRSQQRRISEHRPLTTNASLHSKRRWSPLPPHLPTSHHLHLPYQPLVKRPSPQAHKYRGRPTLSNLTQTTAAMLLISRSRSSRKSATTTHYNQHQSRNHHQPSRTSTNPHHPSLTARTWRGFNPLHLGPLTRRKAGPLVGLSDGSWLVIASKPPTVVPMRLCDRLSWLP